MIQIKQSIMKNDRAKEKFILGTARDQGYKQAAKFIIVCEETSLNNILPFLSRDELIGIIKEVLKINLLTKKDAKNILKDFGFVYEMLRTKYSGGIIKARNMLNKSLGKEIGSSILSQILPPKKDE